MYLLYSLVLTLGFVILLPRFIFDALRRGKYVEGFRQRLGVIPGRSDNRPVIWIHCVSVGETQAARPLVEALKLQHPNHSIVISTITVTGQRLAQQVFSNIADQVFYFPFDWRFSVTRALSRVDPAVVLLMETEIWPRFLQQCSRRGIPVALVNGRISEKSFRRYRLITAFLKRVLSDLKLAVMQAPNDATRIENLGLDKDKLRVAGSLKFDVGSLPEDQNLHDDFTKLRGNRPIILGASTHAPEEKILVESYRSLISKHPTPPRLIIAPRHPERFNEVASLMQASGFSWNRRSERLANDVDLVLLDSIGELPALFDFVDLVFVGGSIATHGGHNVIEPAASGLAIVTGAHTSNFRAIVETFLAAEALVQLPVVEGDAAVQELVKVFAELLTDDRRRALLGQRAKELVEVNRGATARTVRLVEPLFQTASSERVTAAQLR